jgi:hypothetical protein
MQPHYRDRVDGMWGVQGSVYYSVIQRPGTLYYSILQHITAYCSVLQHSGTVYYSILCSYSTVPKVQNEY